MAGSRRKTWLAAMQTLEIDSADLSKQAFSSNEESKESFHSKTADTVHVHHQALQTHAHRG